MADATYQPKVYKNTGGDKLVVASGGVVDIESGGALQIAGTAVTTALTTAPAAVAAGYKIARGMHTTVAAADTVVTGLATVVAVVVSMDSDPSDNVYTVSATIGDQAGTPAAGSIIIKSWAGASASDYTPTAAGTFSKLVSWIAIGT